MEINLDQSRCDTIPFACSCWKQKEGVMENNQSQNTAPFCAHSIQLRTPFVWEHVVFSWLKELKGFAINIFFKLPQSVSPQPFWRSKIHEKCYFGQMWFPRGWGKRCDTT